MSGLGEVILTGNYGDLYEVASRGRLYSACNQAVVSTTAGLATTFTGLAIANPATSGVNLVMRTFHCAQVAAGVACAIGVMTGSGAAAGALTTRNGKVGGAASSATTASAGATIATPVLERVLGSLGSLATTGYGIENTVVFDLQGSIIVPPGFYIASYTSAIVTSALQFAFVWEELSI